MDNWLKNKNQEKLINLPNFTKYPVEDLLLPTENSQIIKMDKLTNKPYFELVIKIWSFCLTFK